MDNSSFPNDVSDELKAPSSRQTTLSCLTTLSHGSSPFIATFLLIHLSAPMLVNLGGSSLASQVMLLGREYYQTSFGENFLLLTPLALHASSGIAKRSLSGSPTKSPRPISSLLSLTGYGALIFIPIHFVTHRLNPSYASVGPELDYEFVKLGLHTWPWRSWILYGGLVGCVVLHAAEGMNIIGSTWLGEAWARWKRSKRTRTWIVAGISAVPVLSGLSFLFWEPLMTFPSLARQYETAFTRSFLYRL